MFYRELLEARDKLRKELDAELIKDLTVTRRRPPVPAGVRRALDQARAAREAAQKDAG